MELEELLKLKEIWFSSQYAESVKDKEHLLKILAEHVMHQE